MIEVMMTLRVETLSRVWFKNQKQVTFVGFRVSVICLQLIFNYETEVKIHKAKNFTSQIIPTKSYSYVMLLIS